MPRTDFAFIAHPESWEGAAAVFAALRGVQQPAIPPGEIRSLLPWIPPRPTCRIVVRSIRGHEASGVGIDAFIPPDRLDARFLDENLDRVHGAVQCAIHEGARIVALGGFSSIVLEGQPDFRPQHGSSAFTTGNTLTVAYIVRGIERAVQLARRDLRDARLLIVGATGDIGSGCARSLAPCVGHLALCARNPDRLRALAAELASSGASIAADTELARVAAGSDLVICVASLSEPSLAFGNLAPDAIVCDAGYPKNVRAGSGPAGGAVFYGGMGQAIGGIRFEPDLWRAVHPRWAPNVVHGCLLEGMALALEERFEPFSRGRGRITPERVAEMWAIAQRHGLALAPLFNDDGPVEARIAALAERMTA